MRTACLADALARDEAWDVWKSFHQPGTEAQRRAEASMYAAIADLAMLAHFAFLVVLVLGGFAARHPARRRRCDRGLLDRLRRALASPQSNFLRLRARRSTSRVSATRGGYR